MAIGRNAELMLDPLVLPVRKELHYHGFNAAPEVQREVCDPGQLAIVEGDSVVRPIVHDQQKVCTMFLAAQMRSVAQIIADI
jgi:hypothetical protein